MTKPTIGDLLSGVAISLRESVLPEIPAGPTRRQIQAAIAIIRRVSVVWDKTGPYLHADNKDIEETLRRICLMMEQAESNGRDADLKPVLQRLGAALDRHGDTGVEYPSPVALGARNVALQGLLVELQDALHEPPSSQCPERIANPDRVEILAMLRALFRRMLEREMEVTAQPARK
jgi:hypothetical protein